MSSKPKQVYIIVYKGGPGSGFHSYAGHHGIPGQQGGSSHLPRVVVKTPHGFIQARPQHYHMLTSSTRQASAAMVRMKKPVTEITYKDGLFYNGDLSKVTGAEEIYAGSHPDVQRLADETGLLATDKQSYSHITKLRDAGELALSGNDDAAQLSQKLDYLKMRIVEIDHWDRRNEYSDNYVYSRSNIDIKGMNAQNLLSLTKEQLNSYGYNGDRFQREKSVEMIQMLEDLKQKGILDGDGLATYDRIIGTPTQAIKTTLEGYGIHKDSLSGNIPLEHETRVAGVWSAWEHQLTDPTAKRDYPVYDQYGNVIKHQLAKSADIKAIRAVFEDPNATISDMHAVYQANLSQRAKLKDGEYYSPNGDKTTKDTQVSRSYWGNTQSTSYGRTTAVDESMDYLNNHYGNMKISDLRAMINNASKELPTGVYNPRTGQGAADMSLIAFFGGARPTTSDANLSARMELKDVAQRASLLKSTNYYVIDYYNAIRGDAPIKYSDMNWSKLISGDATAVWDAYKTVNARNFPSTNSAPTKNFDHYAALSFMTRSQYEAVKQKVTDDWDTSAHGSFSPNIRGAYNIIPSAQVVSANAAVRAKIGGNEMTTYHGTDFGAARYIASGGFKIMGSAKAGRMLGDGIYIATKSSKSAQYVGRSFSRSSGTAGVLFMVRSTLGKVYDVHSNEPTGSSYWNPILKNYDTVWAKKGAAGLANEEACTADPMQNLPTVWLDVVLQ